MTIFWDDIKLRDLSSFYGKNEDFTYYAAAGTDKYYVAIRSDDNTVVWHVIFNQNGLLPIVTEMLSDDHIGLQALIKYEVPPTIEEKLIHDHPFVRWLGQALRRQENSK